MIAIILEGLKQVPSDSCYGCVFASTKYENDSSLCKYIQCDVEGKEYILVEE